MTRAAQAIRHQSFLPPKFFTVQYILYYRIARNVGSGKHWRIWRIDL